jgi:asparagine synthase (glutamine-hydrolysing)
VAAVRNLTRQQFAASGFGPPATYDDSAGVLDFYAKIDYPSSDAVVLADGFAVVAGTFFYDGAIGAEALRRFAKVENPDAALSEADGHFALILRRGTRTVLLRDSVGAFEVFLDDRLGVISTSFLALARTLRRVQMNPQEIYEYVFNGVSLGNATPVTGIHRLGFGERIVLRSVPFVERTARPLPPPICTDNDEATAKNILQSLLDHTAMMARVFDGRIKLALSGGYDSRFLLALFRHCGVSPELFVYGASDSADVLLARRIAATEGLSIRHIDASVLPTVSPEDVPGLIAAKFHREDGLPSGGVFDSDADLIQRADRHAPGYLHVHGGGGEVFRNFFNLLDRSVSYRQFVWLFYSQYDPADCVSDFDPVAYEDAICSKISALLGTEEQRLDRREVESLYPHFRCRSWFGRENSVNSRFGYSVLPFYERRIVNMALAVPIRQKHFGDFEARMIRAVDPALAAYPSNYGHSFIADAPLRARLTAIARYMKPMALRRYSYRIKTHLRAVMRPEILTPEFVRRAVAPDLPRMRRYFHAPQLCSVPQFNRIATLEYLFDQLQAE